MAVRWWGRVRAWWVERWSGDRTVGCEVCGRLTPPDPISGAEICQRCLLSEMQGGPS